MILNTLASLHLYVTGQREEVLSPPERVLPVLGGDQMPAQTSSLVMSAYRIIPTIIGNTAYICSKVLLLLFVMFQYFAHLKSGRWDTKGATFCLP